MAVASFPPSTRGRWAPTVRAKSSAKRASGTRGLDAVVCWRKSARFARPCSMLRIMESRRRAGHTCGPFVVSFSFFFFQTLFSFRRCGPFSRLFRAFFAAMPSFLRVGAFLVVFAPFMPLFCRAASPFFFFSSCTQCRVWPWPVFLVFFLFSFSFYPFSLFTISLFSLFSLSCFTGSFRWTLLSQANEGEMLGRNES